MLLYQLLFELGLGQIQWFCWNSIVFLIEPNLLLSLDAFPLAHGSIIFYFYADILFISSFQYAEKLLLKGLLKHLLFLLAAFYHLIELYHQIDRKLLRCVFGQRQRCVNLAK